MTTQNTTDIQNARLAAALQAAQLFQQQLQQQAPGNSADSKLVDSNGATFSSLVNNFGNGQNNSNQANANLLSVLHSKLQQNQDISQQRAQFDANKTNNDTKDTSQPVKTKKSDNDKNDNKTDNDTKADKANAKDDKKTDSKDETKSDETSSSNDTNSQDQQASNEKKEELGSNLATLGVQLSAADLNALLQALASLGGGEIVQQFQQLVQNVAEQTTQTDNNDNIQTAEVIKALTPILVQTGKKVEAEKVEVKSDNKATAHQLYVAKAFKELKVQNNNNVQVDNSQEVNPQDYHDEVVAKRIFIAGQIQKHNDQKDARIENIQHAQNIKILQVQNSQDNQTEVKLDTGPQIQQEQEQVLTHKVEAKADNTKHAEVKVEQKADVKKQDTGPKAEAKKQDDTKVAKVEVRAEKVETRVENNQKEEVREIFIKVFGDNEVIQQVKTQISEEKTTVEQVKNGNNDQHERNALRKDERNNANLPDWFNKPIGDSIKLDILNNNRELPQLQDFGSLTLKFAQIKFDDTLANIQNDNAHDFQIDDFHSEPSQNAKSNNHEPNIGERTTPNPANAKNTAVELLQKYQEIQSKFLKNIADKLKAQADDGIQKVTLNLQPKELGQVNAELQFQDKNIKISLRATSKDTFEILHNQRETLLNNLQQLGFTSTESDLDLSYNDNNSSGGQGGQNQQQNPGSDNRPQTYNNFANQVIGDFNNFLQGEIGQASNRINNKTAGGGNIIDQNALLASKLLQQLQNNYFNNVNINL